MRKLSLDADSLCVESFATSPGVRHDAGTVQAREHTHNPVDCLLTTGGVDDYTKVCTMEMTRCNATCATDGCPTNTYDGYSCYGPSCAGPCESDNCPTFPCP